MIQSSNRNNTLEVYQENSNGQLHYIFDCPGGNLTTINLKNGSRLSVQDFIFDTYTDLVPTPADLLVSMTLVYSLLIFFGLVGNIITCVVIIRNSSMHTATNCYLFSLAVSDFLFILLGAPLDYYITYFWKFPFNLGKIGCNILPYFSEVMSNSTVLTLVALSVERYVAICHPLKAYRFDGIKRALSILSIIWTVAIVCAVPTMIIPKIKFLSINLETQEIELLDYQSLVNTTINCVIPDSDICYYYNEFEKNPLEDPFFYYVVIATSIFFISPLILLSVLYIRIGTRLQYPSISSAGRHRESSIHYGANPLQYKDKRKNTIRVLVAIVITFFVCWAPFHTYRLSMKINSNFSDNVLWDRLWNAADFFIYLSATANPLLYDVVSSRFRAALIKTFCSSSSPRTMHHQSTETINVSLISRNNSM